VQRRGWRGADLLLQSLAGECCGLATESSLYCGLRLVYAKEQNMEHRDSRSENQTVHMTIAFEVLCIAS
jgi:hypothetical protein